MTSEQEIKAQPNLEGRTARCSAGCGRTQPSSRSLGCFEYRGEGSHAARDHCVCGYYEMAHGEGGSRYACPRFRPHGAYETDGYWCGCNNE
jgi:hypothetical protein